jgi:membrane dipeptidase
MVWSRREFGKWTVGAVGGWALSRPRGSAAAQSRRFGYAGAIVVDALGGPGGFSPGEDPNVPLSWKPLTADMIADAKASGITVGTLTVGALGSKPDVLERTFDQIAFWEQELALHSDVFLKVRKATDLELAKRSGRIGLVYGFQDGAVLGDDLRRLELFHRHGLRVFQPTYNGRNLLGDGCIESGNAGLSRLGHEAVERSNALGLLLDLSHCGQRTTAEAIAASKRPVAITHTGCRALSDVPRNKRDEELRALADRGGVVGIYFMPFLRTKGQPMAQDVVAHLEHAIKVCGEDHVGIGTDGPISPTALTPEYVKEHREEHKRRVQAGIAAPGESDDAYLFVPDLNTVRRLETLGSLLLDRGHPEKRVLKILGGNFARLMREVWS